MVVDSLPLSVIRNSTSTLAGKEFMVLVNCSNQVGSSIANTMVSYSRSCIIYFIFFSSLTKLISLF